MLLSALATAAGPVAAAAGPVVLHPGPRLIVPFPPTGPTEMVGTVPATRVQRAMQAASKSSLSDVLARVVARALDVQFGADERARDRYGPGVSIERLPGAGGQRALRALLDDGPVPRSLLLVSEAICVHAAVADPVLAALVERMQPVATCVEVPYRLVRRADRADTPDGRPAGRLSGARRCSVGSAGYGGRSAALARAVAAAGAFAVSGTSAGTSAGTSSCREVAFNGGAAALQALLGDQVDAAVLPQALAGAWLDDGSLVGAPLPVLRSFGDGSASIPWAGWFGVLASPAWPADALPPLAEALHAALSLPEQQAFLDRIGLRMAIEPGAGLAERIRREQASARAEKKSGAP